VFFSPSRGVVALDVVLLRRGMHVRAAAMDGEDARMASWGAVLQHRWLLLLAAWALRGETTGDPSFIICMVAAPSLDLETLSWW
jgi:hypothetical protein